MEDNMNRLKIMFPKASEAFLRANGDVMASLTRKAEQNAATGRTGARRGIMNKTEIEFSRILDGMKDHGTITRYIFEGMTLRFAGVRYTPDFVVFQTGANFPKLIEVKGRFIKGAFQRAVERFRHAKTYWPEFEFELHQKTSDGWRQII